MNKILRWVIIIGLFAIPFAPLVISSGLLFPFIAGKALFFRVIVTVVFFAYLILVARDPDYRPKKSWLSYLTFIFLVVVFLADVFGINPHKSFWSNFERMEGFFMILHLWMYFVVASTMLSKKYWHKFFATSVGVSLLMSWYGLFQLAGKIDIRQGADRLDATVGNAAYLAVYMLLNLGFATYLYIHHKQETPPLKQHSIWTGISIISGGVLLYLFTFLAAKLPISVGSGYMSTLISIAFWAVLTGGIVYAVGKAISHVSRYAYVWTVVYWTTIFLQFYIIFKTATRGSLLGLFIGLVVASFIYALKAKEDKTGRFIAGGFIGLMILTTLVFVSIRNTSFVQENTTLRRLASISLLDSTQARAFIWPIAIKGGLERPVLGYGQEGFNYVFNKHYNPAMFRHEQWFDRAHNVFLDWFVATGVPGFALYVALYVLALVYIWKGDYSLRAKTVLTGLIVAYTFHNMTVFDNISSYILFFSLLAYVHHNRAVEHIKNINIQVDVRDLIVIPACIIVGIIFMYMVNVRVYKVGSTLIQAVMTQDGGLSKNLELMKKALAYNLTGSQEVREQIINNAETVIRNTEDAQTQQAFFELAKKAIDDQVAYAPTDARGYILAGGFYNRLGQFDLARPLFEKATEYSPGKQSALFGLGTLALNKGENEKGVEYIKKAYDLAPDYPEAQVLYIASLAYAKKTTELNAFLETFHSDYPEMRVVNSLFANKYSQQAIAVLRKYIATTPSFKEQGEAMIKNIQAGKPPVQNQ